MGKNFTSFVFGLGIFLMPVSCYAEFISPIPQKTVVIREEKIVLVREILDLNKRNKDNDVNGIFKDNILLNLHYMKGTSFARLSRATDGQGMPSVDWEKVREPFEFSLTLEPGELFAFHDQILPEFKDIPVKTGWTQFGMAEGYKVLDGLPGNGVCHLATLINWVASEANLEVTAKVNHDFYPVPEIDRKYGTSIIYIPGAYTTQMQNLYVLNKFSYPVTFEFVSDENRVELSILR